MHPKNIDNLKCELSSVNWSEYLTVENVITENVNVITENVNEIFDKCHDKLLDINNKHTPVRKRFVTEKKFRRESWITPSILKCCKKQKKLYKLSIKGNATTAETIKYQEYRRVSNRIKRRVKTTYYYDLCKRLKNNTKKIGKLLTKL